MGVGICLAPPYVTALPTGVIVDGQEVFYAADAANGVIWHLRYRAGSASAYKWEWVGGSPLDVFASANATKSGASLVYGALSDSVPTLTAPLAGDYLVKFAAHGGNNTNSPTFREFIGIRSGATDPSDNDAAHMPFNSAIGRRDVPSPIGMLERVINVATAGNALLMVCRKDAGTPTVNAERRFISARPIRVA